MLNILLVDDEPDFLRLMSLRIAEWGHSLIKAQNGKEAINAITNRSPDIVILDYMMPDMDGVSVLKEIRKINKDIPVIMFTAYPTPKVMKETDKLKISAFVPKLSVTSDTMLLLKSAVDLLERNIEKKRNAGD